MGAPVGGTSAVSLLPVVLIQSSMSGFVFAVTPADGMIFAGKLVLAVGGGKASVVCVGTPVR